MSMNTWVTGRRRRFDAQGPRRSGQGLDVAHRPSEISWQAEGVPREGPRIVRTLSGLDELRPVWDSISTPWGSPMQSHDWIRTCAEVFGLDGSLEVVVAGAGGDVAIAPLFRSKEDGRRLEVVGLSQLHEATDFLYSRESDVAALAAALARSKLPLSLERVPAESPIPAALRKAYRWRGIVTRRRDASCPWIPLDPTWKNPELHLTPRRRSNLRRARRIAEEMGPVSFEILSPKPEAVGALLQEAYSVEAAGWKARQGSALVRDALRGEFFRRYAATAAGKGILRICFLRIGGRAAATQLAVQTRDRFWLLKIGYSEEFARCSPGTLLTVETIRHAALSGLRAYEFLGVDEAWIRAWTPLVHGCLKVRTYPISLRGSVALFRDVSAGLRRAIAAAFHRGR